MITWTDSARATLENHNQGMRQQLLASGADPDEVAADLHRHIEEELTAAKIHVASNGDVQRILARMGTTMIDAPIPQPDSKRIRFKVLLIGAIIVGLVMTSLLYFRVLRHQSSQPADAKNVEAEFPYVIDFAANSPEWGRFAPGDNIVISSVRGNLKHIEVGGRYLVEGTYTLASMNSAILGLSVTAPRRDSPGAVGVVDPEQVSEITRGTGRFSLRETMHDGGSFHVSFSPIGSGESRGTIYFGENNSKDKITISIGGDGAISLNDKIVPDDQLEPGLIEAHNMNADVSVIIKADETSQMKKLTFVMDSCRAAGLTRFSLQSH